MRAIIVLAGLAIVWGCASDPGISAAPEPTVRTENGVTIVENPSLSMADSVAWTIDTAAPLARIGVTDGAAEYMIGRLAGVLRMRDGTILVGDATAHEVRAYDDSGRFIRRIGRAGDGPGEFGWLTHILPHVGDSVAIIDGEASRVSVFDPQLQFVRRFRTRLVETRAPAGLTSHRLIGFFGDGKIAVSDYLNVCGPSRRDGFCEDSVAFYSTDEEGNVKGRFGRFVYSRSHSKEGEVTVSFGEPYPQAYWRVQGNRFYYADAKRFEVKVFRSDGTLERSIRVVVPAPGYPRDEVFPVMKPNTSAPYDEKLQKAVANMEQLRKEAPMPDTLPWFTDMQVDEAGHIWLREYVPAAQRASRASYWYVFDEDGRLRYAVRSPAALMRTSAPYTFMQPQLSADRVLTWERNADGVETVIVLRIANGANRFR